MNQDGFRGSDQQSRLRIACRSLGALGRSHVREGVLHLDAVDGSDLSTAIFLFGFVTFEGIALYHLPVILYFGGMIGLTVVKPKYPDAPRPLVWVAVGVGALAAVGFYILSMITSDASAPPNRMRMSDLATAA